MRNFNKPNPPKSFYNYRVVAEYEWHEKEVLRGWSFTIRGVHYEDYGEKIVGWDSEPIHPSGEDSVSELFNDIEAMSKAMYLPLLIRQGDTLVEYPRGVYLTVQPSHLKKYESDTTKALTGKK